MPSIRRTCGRVASIPRASGFTLIELMVAMVLGLIVIGAVLALSLSMIRANNQTIQATRLTQELRATAAVITSELQRAGSAENPFNLTTANALSAVDATTAGCLIYTYSDNAGNPVNRAISLSGGSVYMGTTACGAGGTKLSSTAVTINTLTFARAGRTINITLGGYMPGAPAISRSYTQTVFAPGLGSI
jgi:prepilin-type N-terminal cleavage/methylation domain-containing protein